MLCKPHFHNKKEKLLKQNQLNQQLTVQLLYED
jgi:hypothetical protein